MSMHVVLRRNGEMYRMLLIVFAVLLHTVSLSTIQAEKPTTDVSVYTEILYPISYQDKTSKEFKGLATDVLREVMEDAKLNFNIQFHSWARSYEIVTSTPNTLLYSVARMPERENDFIWLQKITSLNYGLYTTKKESASMSLDEVKKAYITVTKGGISHKTLLKHGFENFIFIDDYGRISQLVERGRIDIIFTSSLWYKYNKDEFTKPLYKMENIDLSVSDVDLFFVANKGSDQAIIQKLQQSFKKVLNGDSIAM